MIKRIFLISRFNTENFGDLAIAHQFLKEYSLKYDVIPISIFGDMYEHCSVDDVQESKTLHISRAKKVMQLFRFYKNLRANDILVFAGGNMMCDVTTSSQSSKKYVPFIKMAQRKGCIMLALSVGFGPFRTHAQEMSAKRILDECTYITFRDLNSMNRYLQFGGTCCEIQKSVDIGFFFYPRKEIRSIQGSIGINIINPLLLGVSAIECDMIVDSYKRIINEILNRGDKLIVFVTDKSDIPFLTTIESKLDKNEKLEFIIPKGLQELYEIYSKIDVLIGARMHSMILGYSTGTPIIGVSWQDKITDLFSLLNYDNRCFNMASLDEHVTDIVDICYTIMNDYFNEQLLVLKNYNKLDGLKQINDKFVDSALSLI